MYKNGNKAELWGQEKVWKECYSRMKIASIRLLFFETVPEGIYIRIKETYIYITLRNHLTQKIVICAVLKKQVKLTHLTSPQEQFYRDFVLFKNITSVSVYFSTESLKCTYMHTLQVYNTQKFAGETIAKPTIHRLRFFNWILFDGEGGKFLKGGSKSPKPLNQDFGFLIRPTSPF